MLSKAIGRNFVFKETMMIQSFALMGIMGMTCIGTRDDSGDIDRKKQAAVVLDDWHAAAAAADEGRYFAHFTADAVMLGTDATERWTRDEFQKWAKPYFGRGKAWTFKATRRNVALSKDGNIAWFDEKLDTPNLGPARGSGVLVWDGKAWHIAQYNLSVPIPNDAFEEVKQIIEKVSKAKKKE